MKKRNLLSFLFVAGIVGGALASCGGNTAKDTRTDQEIVDEAMGSSAIIVTNKSAPVRDTTYGVKNILEASSGAYIKAYTSFNVPKENEEGSHVVTIEWKYDTTKFTATEVTDSETSATYMKIKPIWGTFGTVEEASITGTGTFNEATATKNYTVELNSNKNSVSIKDMPTSGDVAVKGYITGFIDGTTADTWYGVTVQAGSYGFMIYNIPYKSISGYKVGDCIEVIGTSSPYNNTRQVTGSTAVVELLTGDDAAEVEAVNYIVPQDVDTLTTDTYGSIYNLEGLKITEVEDVTNYYNGKTTEHAYVQAKALYQGKEVVLYSDRYNAGYEDKVEWYNKLKEASDSDGSKTINFKGMHSSAKWATVTGSGDSQSTSSSTLSTPGFMLVDVDYTEVSNEAYKEVKILKMELDGNVFVGGTANLVLSVSGESTVNTDYTFTSSDETVATVSEAGVVTGIKAGTTTITATSKTDSTLTTTLDVEVTAEASEPAYLAKSVSEVLEVEYDGSATQAYVVRGKIKGFGNSGTDSAMNKYGSMVITDETDTTKEILVYNLTEKVNALTFDTAKGTYSFKGANDGLSGDNIKNLQIGDTVSMVAIRADYKGTVELKGVFASANDTKAIAKEVTTLNEIINDAPVVDGQSVKATLAAQKVYKITGTISKWNGTKTDGTQYGNFYIKDDEGTEVLVYGCTAQTGMLQYSGGYYSLSNPKDWLTNDTTSGLTIGDKVTIECVRCDYKGTAQLTGDSLVKA